MELENRVCVVTGGASGLGLATVEDFVAAGAKVAVFDLNEEAGEALASRYAGDVMFREVNIADDDAVSTAIDDVMQAFGAIHVCVNCAGRGGGATKTLSKKGRFPMELFRDVININLVGTFSVLSRVAEKWRIMNPT